MQAVCSVEMSDDTEPATRQIVYHANVLLAEICAVTLSAETNRMDRKLWRKRLARAERCSYVVEQALQTKRATIAVSLLPKGLDIDILPPVNTGELVIHGVVVSVVCSA